MRDRRLFIQLGTAVEEPMEHPFYSLGPLIGRSADLAALLSRVLDPVTRMVALTGPVGVGKSRLAAELLKGTEANFADGALFVDLAWLTDGQCLARQLADALLGDADPGPSAVERLRAHLADRELFLVLDHCEDRLSEVVSLGSALLAECPRLHLLCVGQEPPKMYGVGIFRLSPLPVPESGPPATTAELARNPSVELFLYRAGVVRPGFTVTDANRHVIAELCRRLDGLPLAIELAAARLKLHTPGGLLAELGQGLDCLEAGRADTLSRHLSMQAAIACSHDRLSAEERSLFACLAVFVSEFGITAADAVIRPAHAWVHRSLETLVDKNLLMPQDQVTGELTFSMLNTFRTYALTQLQRSNEFERVKRNHASYFLASAQAAEQELAGPGQGKRLKQLVRWNAELRAAFTFFMDRAEGHAAAAMAAALRPYWFAMGRLREGARWLEDSLSVGGLTLEHEAKALDAAGEIGAWLHDPMAEERLVRARKIYQTLRDHRGEAACVHHLGVRAYFLGEVAEAERLLEEAILLRRAAGDLHGHARVARDLATLRRDMGKPHEAARLAEAALRIFRKFQDQREIAITWSVLAEVAADEGDLSRAEELSRSALPSLRERGVAHAYVALELAARLLSRRGRTRECWRLCTSLLAAADRLRSDTGCALPVHRRPALDDLTERARIRLGGTSFAAAWVEGVGYSLDRAIEQALAPAPRESREGLDPDVGLSSPLTPREQEVAELVAHGLTNREIARRLGIAEWTAVNHLRKVMRKLNCSSRVNVANWVAQQQLEDGLAAHPPVEDRAYPPRGFKAPTAPVQLRSAR